MTSNTYKCDSCNKYFSSIKGLSMHLNYHPECRQKSYQSVTSQLSMNKTVQHEQKKRKIESLNLDNNSTTNNVLDDHTVEDEFSNDSVNEPFAYSNDSRVEIMLLKLLNNIGAPHYAFKDLMEWAHDAYISGYKFSPKCSSYQQQINKVEKWLNLSKCRPFQKQVNLPPDDLQLQVTCFPFIPMLESLFNDPEINHECNLVINTKDPFSQYKSKNGSLGEVNSGNWY